MCLIVLKCMWLYWPVFIIKRVYRILQEHIKPIGSLKKGTLQIGIRAKVSTLYLDGIVERSLDRKCEEKLGLEWPISDVGCSSVSSSCLTVFTNSGGLAVL
jgi:hypothetical protein